jgi:hypothetical protein
LEVIPEILENSLKVFKSDKFDVDDTASLSLFFYPDSVFIFAKDQNSANIGIHYYSNFKWESLEKLLTSDPLLRFEVPIKVYLHHGGYALVPGALFQSGKENEFLSFSCNVPEDSYFFNTPLDSNNLQVVSFVPHKIKKVLSSRFSEITFYHGACSFLSYLFKERFNLIGQEILVDYQSNHIYIAAFTDQELSAFNMFEIDQKIEIVKYILIFIEQLKYDRNHVRVSLFGATDKSGISENWGKEYFVNFRLVKPHANQNYSHGFKHLKSENLFEAYWQYD